MGREFYEKRKRLREEARRACLAIRCPRCGAVPLHPCANLNRNVVDVDGWKEAPRDFELPTDMPNREWFLNDTPHSARVGRWRAQQDEQCP